MLTLFSPPSPANAGLNVKINRELVELCSPSKQKNPLILIRYRRMMTTFYIFFSYNRILSFFGSSPSVGERISLSVTEYDVSHAPIFLKHGTQGAEN